MGNGILSRSSSGDGAKIGDIRLTTRDSIGAKWALCNGDIVDSGSPIAEYCSFDPSDVSNWVDLSGVVDPAPNIVLYDPTNNVYWGIYISNPASSSAKTVNFYRYDRDERGQYQSVYYTTSLTADEYIYDACFIHDEEQGDKIAFTYYSSGDEYIEFFDITSKTILTSKSIYLGNDGVFSSYKYDTGSTIRNGSYRNTLAAAGRFLIFYNEYEMSMVSYDSRTGSIVSYIKNNSYCSDMYSYASGPYHTGVAYIDEAGGICVLIINNSTGKSITDRATNATDNGEYTSISCIYEKDEDCQYFIWFCHGDTTTVYRGYIKVTASGSVTQSSSTTTGSDIFGSSAAYNGSMYEFKANGNYYAIALNSYSSGCKLCTLSGKAGTVNNKTTMTMGGVYSADRNIFGYKTGPSWYFIANGNGGDVYFTAPCLPVLQEGSYNGFIKVEN